MSQPRAFDKEDLTVATRRFADQVDERLRNGAKTFQGLKLIVAGLAPLVLASFLLGAYNTTLAKKTALEALEQSETARHVELEKRTAVLETQRIADNAVTSKALESINAHLGRMDDVLLDLRIKFGTTPPSSAGKRGR